VHALSHEIFTSYVFDSTATDWATPVDTVLEQRRGVCQDFAHLAVAVLRQVGLPASYISGYIETEPPPGEVKSIGADASHAWCSTWIPDHGWLDFDPTNDQMPPERHVTVGWGRDYADVAPVRGVVLGPSARQIMTVAVDVARIDPATVTAAEP
jgi:transglutaminase-like putative cysteine protease